MKKVSAPGKIHLIGEHSVVYGEPAIIATINKRCIVEAETSSNVCVVDRAMGLKGIWKVATVLQDAKKSKALWEKGHLQGDFSKLFSFVKEKSFIGVAIGTVLEHLGLDSGVNLKIFSEIVSGAGLGSSAALSVALAKLISEMNAVSLSKNELNEISFEIEKLSHGVPSGGDNSACCFGGFIWFQKGNPNIIIPLRNNIPHNSNDFVLVFTKEPEKTTGELVQQVMHLNKKFRDKRIKALGNATRKMLEALKTGDFPVIKELINFAQKNLAELGVSTPEIDEIADSVKRVDGAAKLCGAGGGGFVLCYHEERAKLLSTIRKMGYEPLEIVLGVEGVTLETQGNTTNRKGYLKELKCPITGNLLGIMVNARESEIKCHRQHKCILHIHGNDLHFDLNSPYGKFALN